MISRTNRIFGIFDLFSFPAITIRRDGLLLMTFMNQFNFRIPEGRLHPLDEEARLQGRSRSGVVRSAFAEFPAQRQRERNQSNSARGNP